MTGKNLDSAFLRQLPGSGAEGQHERRYSLSTTEEVVLGREPGCQIYLDSSLYGKVSRRHVAVRPFAADENGSPTWLLCDLNSANGTYVNGQRLQGCQMLMRGDRITLGNNGPEFIFEYQLNHQSPQQASPQVPPAASQQRSPAAVPLPSHSAPSASPPNEPNSSISFTQLFPIISTRRDLVSKAYLIPGILTVVVTLSLLLTLDSPILFIGLLGIYIAGMAFYFVYQLCGKHKPWWLLLGSTLMTGAVFVILPVFSVIAFFFRDVLPGGDPFKLPDNASFLQQLWAHFLGAGLTEELYKALPIVVAYLWGRRLRPPARERIGVWEPLDGILLGAASAVGFTLLETLGEYVPGTVQSVAQQTGNAAAGISAGLQLLIVRVLGSVAGHMAYSGYFGYFIGLSVLKPRKRWRILAVGYLTASALHALWNSSINIFVNLVVGVVSYTFLVGAILKARALSPTRSQNFATRFSERP